jgi:hypothetical protein
MHVPGLRGREGSRGLTDGAMLVYGDREPTESPDTARRAALQACRESRPSP